MLLRFSKTASIIKLYAEEAFHVINYKPSNFLIKLKANPAKFPFLFGLKLMKLFVKLKKLAGKLRFTKIKKPYDQVTQTRAHFNSSLNFDAHLKLNIQ